MSTVPLVDLKANYLRIKDAIDAEMEEVLSNTSFILGPKVTEFERAFGAWVHTEHCVGVSSGTDALRLAMLAAGIGPGDEVITQANTYVATVYAIDSVGATTVLVDVDERTMMIDPEQVRNAITEKTKAIVPVHLYGMSADMDAILEIARERNVLVIEDASQAHGATFKGRHCGSFGDLAGFSFYPGKNLGCFGDGGAVVTNDGKYIEHLHMLRNLGQKVKYYHEIKGWNCRLDTLQAAVLNGKLPHMDAFNQERRDAANKYMQLLAAIPQVRLPEIPADCVPVWHLFVIRVDADKRNALLAHLHANKVGAGIHYPVPIHELGAFKEEFASKVGERDFPISTLAARQMISLPMFPELTDEQIQQVVDSISSFFAE